MAGFWYFLPGLDKAGIERNGRLKHSVISDLDLSDVLHGVSLIPDDVITQDVAKGPGDMQGCLLYPIPQNGSVPRNPGYDADAQQYRSCRGGFVWMGWLIDEPPTPADLERKTTVSGHSIADEYGLEWTIPIARAEWNSRGTLPVAFGFDENDEPITGVSPRYRGFWDNACKLYDLIGTVTSITGEGEEAILNQRFTEDQDAFLFGMVRQALGINYRVENAELATLDVIRPGWLSVECLRPMVNAICDLEAYRQFFEASKKKASLLPAGGLSSSHGKQDDIQTTAPA